METEYEEGEARDEGRKTRQKGGGKDKILEEENRLRKQERKGKGERFYKRTGLRDKRKKKEKIIYKTKNIAEHKKQRRKVTRQEIRFKGKVIGGKGQIRMQAQE